MVAVFPEQRITRSIHRDDVIDVGIMDSGSKAAAAAADTRHAEELLTILLPLATIATLGSTRPVITWMSTLKCWLLGAELAASTISNQYPRMHTARTR